LSKAAKSDYSALSSIASSKLVSLEENPSTVVTLPPSAVINSDNPPSASVALFVSAAKSFAT
jgi:hypothetical protein